MIFNNGMLGTIPLNHGNIATTQTFQREAIQKLPFAGRNDCRRQRVLASPPQHPFALELRVVLTPPKFCNGPQCHMGLWCSNRRLYAMGK